MLLGVCGPAECVLVLVVSGVVDPARRTGCVTIVGHLETGLLELSGPEETELRKGSSGLATSG